jgi:hypothetical protein
MSPNLDRQKQLWRGDLQIASGSTAQSVRTGPGMPAGLVDRGAGESGAMNGLGAFALGPLRSLGSGGAELAASPPGADRRRCGATQPPSGHSNGG